MKVEILNNKKVVWRDGGYVNPDIEYPIEFNLKIENIKELNDMVTLLSSSRTLYIPFYNAFHGEITLKND